MTRTEIFNILRPIILSVTGVPECILANPNASSPQGEYASIEPKQSLASRGVQISKTNGGIRQVNTEIKRQIRVDASVQFWRGNALDRSELLNGCQFNPNIGNALFKAGLNWIGTSQSNNLTALQSANYEERAEITITLSYEAVDSDLINNIESAEVIVSEIHNGADRVLGSVEIA
jgi:hypothetical protein